MLYAIRISTYCKPQPIATACKVNKIIAKLFEKKRKFGIVDAGVKLPAFLPGQDFGIWYTEIFLTPT